MKLVKAIVWLNMAHSNSEAIRLVKQGAVWIGSGCKPECEYRRVSFRCTCGGQRKAADPFEELEDGIPLRVGDGNPKQGLDGSGWVPWIPSERTDAPAHHQPTEAKGR